MELNNNAIQNYVRKIKQMSGHVILMHDEALTDTQKNLILDADDNLQRAVWKLQSLSRTLSRSDK